MVRVLNFGASISSGFWDPEGGWFHYLKEDFHRKALEDEKFQCYNLGVSGQDSSEIVDRMEDEIEARNHRKDRDFIILINAGGNDTLYMNEKDEMRVPLEEFKENLRKMIDTAKDYAGEKVFFIASSPVKYEILDPLPWSKEESILRENREKYMETAEMICEEKGVKFIPISRNLDNPKEFADNTVDGVHPGTEGHRNIYEIVKEVFQERGLL
jgi:lysophospholipase L1-like esterase